MFYSSLGYYCYPHTVCGQEIGHHSSCLAYLFLDHSINSWYVIFESFNECKSKRGSSFTYIIIIFHIVKWKTIYNNCNCKNLEKRNVRKRNYSYEIEKRIHIYRTDSTINFHITRTSAIGILSDPITSHGDSRIRRRHSLPTRASPGYNSMQHPASIHLTNKWSTTVTLSNRKSVIFLKI